MNKLADKPMQEPVYLDGIKDIIQFYDLFILDIWGVLHNGKTCYPHTVDTLTALKLAKKKICLVSNTGHLHDFVVNHLEMMGISRKLYDTIITAGDSARSALTNRPDQIHISCGHKCYHIGDDPLLPADNKLEIIEGIGIEVLDSPNNASFILNSCGGIPSDRMNSIYEMVDLALPYNLPMICVNPDLIVDIGESQYACAGTFAKYYETKGGTVIYHGKPHIAIYEHVAALFDQIDKTRMIAIGDSLHTDIKGAANFQIESILNLCGIHKNDVNSDVLSNTINTKLLKELLNKSPALPQAYMQTFRL